MGLQESKLEQLPKQEIGPKETSLHESAPSTPILTPLDPRSPSVNIARTPLELILAANTSENLADELEGDNIETKELANVILGIDPRSPTVEFNRTPIIVGAVTKQKSTKLQNKNLDNVRKTEIQTTPVTVKKSSKIVPPKLLSTSPVSIISNYNKRKSFVGLLETNLDFTETDLDSVCQRKHDLNMSLPIEIKDVPCNELKSQMEALQSEMIPEKCEKEIEVPAHDKILEEKVINVTAQVKDFDKKLTNLIYQDDSEDDNKVSLRVNKVKENNRTPLSIRNSNDEPKKASRLRVSDKPRKSEISKIPVFKDHSRRIAVQCENTPPSKLEEVKHRAKMSHWDADKTLII